jgi:lipoprotein-releasing system permease protein
MAALLASLGMSPNQIRNIFWYYAAFIAGVGVVAGWALGLGLLWLQMKTGFIQMDETTYYVSQMPVKIIAWQVLAVGLGSFAICVLVLRLPLRYLDKISIIRALRFR